MSAPPSLSIDDARLAALRRAYDPAALVAANVEAVAAVSEGLRPWNEGIGRSFYDPSGPLSPASRERCLIALLTAAGQPLPLAIHVYWGLMEGLSVEEVVQIVGLASCYAGLSRLSFGLEVVRQALQVLARPAPDTDDRPAAVLAALREELRPGGPRAQGERS